MALIQRFLLCTIRIVTFLLAPVVRKLFDVMYSGKAKSVSEIRDPILLQSGTSLAKKIRSRELTAVSVLESFMNRVDEVNGIVNAVVWKNYEVAIKEAERIDKILSSDVIDEKYSEKNAPFLGVPHSIKESFEMKGSPYTAGVVSRKKLVITTDSPVITNLRQAGIVPYIKTNISELCLWYESSNKVYGQTNNAYDSTRIVGGSSGGEGCILSAGGAVLGLGADIGGSIRMPAYFNGVFGHKPTMGIVSNVGQYPTTTGRSGELLGTGPLCRYAEDLAPLLSVMAGNNAEKLNLDKKVDLKSLKIYIMKNDGGNVTTSPVDPQITDAIRKAGDHLASLGAKVSSVHFSKFMHTAEMWTARMIETPVMEFHELMDMEPGLWAATKEIIRWLFGFSDHTFAAVGLAFIDQLKFLKAAQVRSRATCEALREDLLKTLGGDGILLYPPHPKLAPHHGQPLFYIFNYTYTAIFNALVVPVTQVPLGLSKEGLPLGVQVVAAPYNDRMTIAVAQELEKAFGGWVPPGSNR